MSDVEHWEARFSGEDYHFGTAPNAFLARQRPRLSPGQTALCIADGEGRNGVWLAEQGLKVTSVDFAPSGRDKALRLAAARGVSLDYQLCDIFEYDWPEAAFDVVVGIFFQFAPPKQRAALFEGMKKALKPGGLMLIEGYGPKQIEYGTGGPGVPEQLYTRELLEEAFDDFAELEVETYDAELDEGSRHKGISALVDLVGRK